MGKRVPHDVVSNHILPRVPAKSVCRFNCVSKEWYSFLTSDVFKNKHNRLHIDDLQNTNKLLVLSKTKTSFEFTTIDCEAPPSDKDLTPTRRPLPPFEGITPSRINILASFHGIVCLGIQEMDLNEYSHLVLWNPLTNEYKRLSESNPLTYVYYPKFGLYYNCCEDDYKLLFVDSCDDNVYICSLKTDSWRKLDVFQYASIYHERWSQGTYLNENLYFLGQDINNQSRSIIRFDTKTERLSKIEIPYVDDNLDAYDHFATILLKSDCIHVCEKYDIEISGSKRTCIKLCKFDKHENWTEVVNYQLKHDDYIIPYLRPVHLMKNGNWLMINHRRKEHCIYEVDLKEKKHIKDKSDKDKGNIYDDYELYGSIRVDNMHLRFDNHVGYTETFVSPNQHMK